MLQLFKKKNTEMTSDQDIISFKDPLLTHTPFLFALVPMPPAGKGMHLPSPHGPWSYLELCPPQAELSEFINTEHRVKFKFQVHDKF